MPFRVKELFYTLQGEGVHAGRPAVFCRFSGCNLWSGRPEDRATAKCRFCDTDFVGADAGVFAVKGLADAIEAAVDKVYAAGYRTPDLWGEGLKKVGTREIGKLIAAAVEK